MADFINDHYPFFIVTHFVGFIIGLGAATVSDLLFFKFIRDFKIGKFEYEVLRYLSKLVWIGVIIFTASGLAMFYANTERLLNSDAFMAKATVSIIVIVNGAMMHLKVIPHLRELKLKGKLNKKESALRLEVLVGGAISVISWYSVLFLALTKGFGRSYSDIMITYLIILGLGITGALLINRYLSKLPTK